MAGQRGNEQCPRASTPVVSIRANPAAGRRARRQRRRDRGEESLDHCTPKAQHGFLLRCSSGGHTRALGRAHRRGAGDGTCRLEEARADGHAGSEGGRAADRAGERAESGEHGRGWEEEAAKGNCKPTLVAAPSLNCSPALLTWESRTLVLMQKRQSASPSGMPGHVPGHLCHPAITIMEEPEVKVKVTSS